MLEQCVSFLQWNGQMHMDERHTPKSCIPRRIAGEVTSPHLLVEPLNASIHEQLTEV